MSHIDDRLQELAEAWIDELNTEHAHADGTVMLTSFVLLVEGNGYTPDGVPLTRVARSPHGSPSQVKGLLLDALDHYRREDDGE